MTRINCVPVKELSLAHFGAEYRELPRLRHLWPRMKPPEIPPTYRMGKGHVLFFADKGLYLIKRYKAIVELRRKLGLVVNYPELDLYYWPEYCMNDWKPTKEAIIINRIRLKEREPEYYNNNIQMEFAL